MNGALLVDKPTGPTSHDIVAFVRRAMKAPRVGHTGTLDPLASGLLVLLLGQATRLAQFLGADEKEYVADVRLGVATRTYDAASLDESAVRAPATDGRWPTGADVEAVLTRFRGSFRQTPPPFSAKKIASVPAYEKARKNQVFELNAVPVTVRELQVLPTSDIGHPSSDIDRRGLVRLRVVASSGFYVRSLAHDLGQELGCGAHLEALRRTRAGRFHLADALTLDRVEAAGADALVTPNALVADMPWIELTEEGLRRASHGNEVGPSHIRATSSPADQRGRVRLVDAAGDLVAVAELRDPGVLHPLVVLR